MVLIKLFQSFIKTPKMQICKHWGSSIVGSKMKSTYNEAIDMDLFSLEDKEKILEVINSRNMKDLLQYSITKKHAQILELHRVARGPYKSLEDLLQVENMNNKCLNKFYESIICGNRKSYCNKIIHGLVLTPKLTGDENKDVNTVLGIYIGQNMISWSLLNRDCEVLQWNYETFSQDGSKNDLHSLLQMTLPIAAKLPKADRYIMQEICGSGDYQRSRKFYQVYIEQSIINAIILSYLTMFNHNAEFVVNNIFILRQRIVRKIYGLKVGKETISTQYMVQKLLQENDGDEVTGVKENLPSVLIRTELRHMYNALSPVYQEQISWSLLIALAFVELVVHQRTDRSFATLNRL